MCYTLFEFYLEFFGIFWNFFGIFWKFLQFFPFFLYLCTSNLIFRKLIIFDVCILNRYFLGLLTATVSSEVFKAAQPALLYLVPFTLLPLLTMAYLKVNESFAH